jgi:N-terminal domain of galactosyltransferase
VDTLPFHKIFDYETKAGIVKHHYGFEYALGGIVVIKGMDFERINGFPNFWGWGNEDSVLQTRCNKYNLKIDRTLFYKIGSPEILQLFDGVSRLISPNEYSLGKSDIGVDGLTSIKNLSFSIDTESLNPNDNKYIVNNPNIFVINIITFNSLISANQNEFYDYDLREKPNKIINPDPSKLQMTKKVLGTEDWVNIPQLNNEVNTNYKKETQRFKNNQLENPQQIEERIIQDNLKINNDKNERMRQQQELVNNYISRLKNSQLNSSIPHPHRQQQQKPPPHRYSKEYASYIGAKPRATSSMGVNINLGGLSVKR